MKNKPKKSKKEDAKTASKTGRPKVDVDWARLDICCRLGGSLVEAAEAARLQRGHRRAVCQGSIRYD